MGKLAQQAAIWIFIFLGAIVVAGLWSGHPRTPSCPRQAVMQDGAQVVVPMQADGHFYLTLEVNGTPVRFVVDTGADRTDGGPNIKTEKSARGCRTRVGSLPAGGAGLLRPRLPSPRNRPGRYRRPCGLANRSLWAGSWNEGVRAVVNSGDLGGGGKAPPLLGMSYSVVPPLRPDRDLGAGQLVLER